MLEFRKFPDPNNAYDNTTIIMETTEVCLPEILQDFTCFLKACGFQLYGLEVTYNDEEEI